LGFIVLVGRPCYGHCSSFGVSCFSAKPVFGEGRIGGGYCSRCSLRRILLSLRLALRFELIV